jgi:hypothetical protein
MFVTSWKTRFLSDCPVLTPPPDEVSERPAQRLAWCGYFETVCQAPANELRPGKWPHFFFFAGQELFQAPL